jgi:hypothetical protein
MTSTTSYHAMPFDAGGVRNGILQRACAAVSDITGKTTGTAVAHPHVQEERTMRGISSSSARR